MKIFQSSIFRGLCAIVVGVLLIKFPQDGVTWLTVAIGAIFLLSGVIAFIAYISARRHAGEYTITDQQGRIISGSQPTFPIVGAGSVILGLTLVVTPGVFVNGLMYILSIIMILGGINMLMSLISARRLGPIPFAFWIAPSLILLTGLFVILKPMESAELPLLILGWCSLLFGMAELINAIKIYTIHKAADRRAEELAHQREAEESGMAEEISSETNTESDGPTALENKASTTTPDEPDEYDEFSAD